MLEITLTGTVGSCKLVTTSGKSSVLNINIATNRRVGDREFTDWTAAKVWGERAEKLASHVAKGAKLLIKGRPEAKGYVAGDGTPKGELIVHVSELEFLSPKAKSETSDEPAEGQTATEPELAMA